MNQWETETVQIGLVIFAVLFVIFAFTRKRWARSVFLPRMSLLLNFAWLVSAIIYVSAQRFFLLEGLPFAAAYAFLIFASPLLIAAGFLEGLVVIYHVSSIKTSWPTLSLRKHALAFLSAAFCLCVYLIARHLGAGKS
jgi:hypothetical protein